jgi:hypothetical protein
MFSSKLVVVILQSLFIAGQLRADISCKKDSEELTIIGSIREGFSRVMLRDNDSSQSLELATLSDHRHYSSYEYIFSVFDNGNTHIGTLLVNFEKHCGHDGCYIYEQDIKLILKDKVHKFAECSSNPN